MKCIYCGEEKNNFNKEHVIPQLLGTFEPVDPTFLEKDKLVCSNCNSVIFCKLETEFKEDSYEGILSQQLNLTNSNSVRIRGVNVKMTNYLGIEDDFFNEIFPFFKIQNEEFVLDFKSQIKVKNYNGESGYQIFLFEALKKIKKNSCKFEKMKKRIKATGKNNFAIFTCDDSEEDDNQINEAIELLKDYGISYKENKIKSISINSKENKKFNINKECKITPNICRFIAKVAFNYFLYCALQDKKHSILYEARFDRIKKFILAKDEEIKRREIIVEVSNDPITWHEKKFNKRFLGHIVVFFEEKGWIFSKITFLGGKVYKVLLGKAEQDFMNKNFGCGHLFFPFNKSIHNLTQQSQPNKLLFGLFLKH